MIYFFSFLCEVKKKTFMKKILILAVVAGFAITSCKNDDEETPPIVGTWKINKSTYKYGDGTSDTEIPDACESKSNFTFKEDGVLINDEYYISGSSTCTPDYSTGSYSYNENEKNLYLNFDGSTETFKVITLNNSELVLAGEKDDYDGDGTDDDFTLYLKK